MAAACRSRLSPSRRTGVCWDNAVAESFFASLKKEARRAEFCRNELSPWPPDRDFGVRRVWQAWNHGALHLMPPLSPPII